MLTGVIGALAVPALASPPAKTVKIVNYAYRPAKLTIRKRTRVTWKWAGGFIGHNVTVIKGPVKFHSQSKASGTFSHLFARRGTYHIYCTLHSYMTETIIVQ